MELTEQVTKAQLRLGYVEVVCKSPLNHSCAGYRLMKANTLPDKRVCDNCGGPVKASGESSCWPDLIILEDFPK